MTSRRTQLHVFSLALVVAMGHGARCGQATASDAPPGHAAPSQWERSFWIHASLATTAVRGYWDASATWSGAPSEDEVRRAAKRLCDDCAANRLYLVYHREIPIADAERVFGWWRRHCPAGVLLTPALVLRMYDARQTSVFSSEEIGRLTAFFQQSIDSERVAVYDVYPRRDQGEALAQLARRYPQGLIRVGIQPDERIMPPFVVAVQDTWSGLCHGKTNADWLDRGFGAETLRAWVASRNRDRRPVAWDLVVVAWDYSATERGGYPGYDDAAKNMPLPAGRNRLAVGEIVRAAKPECLAGFSSDLTILQANSLAAAHDGAGASFYETLRRGQHYRGYYADALNEIVGIYRELAEGKLPRGEKAVVMPPHHVPSDKTRPGPAPRSDKSAPNRP